MVFGSSVWETVDMRTLRIIKRTPIAIGICEHCNAQFKSKQPVEEDAEAEMMAQFETHKCTRLDSSQNALRIVREATENK
jgi:hypothetical protein